MRVSSQVLVLLVGFREDCGTAARVKIAADRIRRWCKTSSQRQVSVAAAFVGDAEQTGVLVKEHRPIIVHILKHNKGSLANLSPIVNGLSCAFAADPVDGRLVVMEDCFSLGLAEELAGHAQAVTGINGRFKVKFLSQFYAMLRIGKQYHEVFYKVHWAFSNNFKGTAAAAEDERPYFLTLNRKSLETETAGSTSPAPSHNFSRSTAFIVSSMPAPEDAVAYPLFYATNRKLVDPNNIMKGYSGEREESRVHYGTCTVTVPKSHKIGSSGSPWWKQLLTQTEDGQLELQWTTLRSLVEEAYWAQVSSEIRKANSGQRTSVVYLHGYSVTFEDAAIRAAQLGADLKVDGIMSFFSWPSKGRRTAYLADEASIGSCELEITAYLHQMLKMVGNSRLHVIAHSMGSRGLLRAMINILNKVKANSGTKFGQIFLAAPDEDTMVFRKLADVYPKITERTTLYVSSKDKALATSGIIHDYPRAGYTPPVTVIPGIDTVETEAVDLTFLGHGYYSDAKSVLGDMYTLMKKDQPPSKRDGLKVVVSDGLRYWQFD